MAEKSSKEVAEKAKSQEVALSEEMSDFLDQDAGAGMEKVTSEDVTIPFINVLQSLSPQLRKQNAEYISEAEEGMFFNTATQEVFDGEKGIVVIPVFFMRRYTEWVLRDKGGGLVQDHGDDSSVMNRTTRDEHGRDITENGTQIVVSGTHYVMIVRDDGTVDRAVLAMSSTQLKVSRRWNTMMQQIMVRSPKSGQQINPASFYMSYLLTTVPESNDKGSWMSIKVQKHKPVPELENGTELYKMARKFKEDISAGTVRAAPPPDDQASSDDPGEAF